MPIKHDKNSITIVCSNLFKLLTIVRIFNVSRTIIISDNITNEYI